jgi:hypothetical protein
VLRRQQRTALPAAGNAPIAVPAGAAAIRGRGDVRIGCRIPFAAGRPRSGTAPMNRLSCRCLLLLAPGLLSAAAVAAVEPSCAPVIAAFRAKAEAADWHSLMVADGMRLEAMARAGEVRSRIDGGAWRAMPNHAAREHELVAAIAASDSAVSGCSSAPGAAIAGQAITVHRFRLALPGAPVAQVELHVGADGRPYRQQDGDVAIDYRYDGESP